MGFKVLGLKVANLRNIDLVEVDFKGKGFVEVTGKNGSGKSTMLDAIFAAILGTKHFGRGFDGWRIVQTDKEKALIKVTIGNKDRQIEVRRSITVQKDEEGKPDSTGGSLTIVDSDGEKLGQEFLDRLLSEFTVDPLAFTRKAPKEQVELLKRMAGIDTESIEALIRKAREERLVANRMVTASKAKVPAPTDPCDRIDTQKLREEKESIIEKNEATRKEIEARKSLLSTAEDRKAKAKEEQEEIDRLLAQVEEHKRRKSLFEEAARKAEEEANFEVEAIQSTEAIDALLADANRINAKADAYDSYIQASKEWEEAKKEAKKWDDELDRLTQVKTRMITESKLPFKNLTFDDEVGILVDGIPFTQKSTAEQIRMSTRIGMEMDPELRVICIRDGSMLDEDSFWVIHELAERHDYQVLVESVGEKQGEDQIVLRAGHVISNFEAIESTAGKARRMDSEL